MGGGQRVLSFLPCAEKSGIRGILSRQVNPCADEPYFLSQATKAINEFQPNVIQVFGSELWYGLVKRVTTVPVILHFQGSMIAYANAKYPPNTTFHDVLSYQPGFLRTPNDACHCGGVTSMAWKIFRCFSSTSPTIGARPGSQKA